MTDDFKNHPKSIGEIKADKASDGALWTPRDALISALRDLDSGVIQPDAVVVICGKREDNNTSRCTYYQSSRNNWEMLGLIEEAKLELLR